jgi:hypothetical protein
VPDGTRLRADEPPVSTKAGSEGTRMTRWVEQGGCGRDPVVPHPLGREAWVSVSKKPYCGHANCRDLYHRITMAAWWLEVDRRQIRGLDDSCVLAIEVD